MRTSLRPRSIYDIFAVLGCLAALSTGGAYAASAIGSNDIIDNSIRSVDLGNGQVRSVDIGANQVAGPKIRNGSVTGADVLEGSFAQVPSAGAVDGLDANSIARAASLASPATPYVADGSTVLASVTMTAPVRGFVTLFGSTTADYFAGCQVFCATHVRIRDVEAGLEYSSVSFTGAVTSANTRQGLSPVATIAAPPGTRTYQLVGTWFGVAPGFSSPSLSAIFTPFDGDGAAPAARPTDGAATVGPRRTTDTPPDMSAARTEEASSDGSPTVRPNHLHDRAHRPSPTATRRASPRPSLVLQGSGVPDQWLSRFGLSTLAVLAEAG